MTRFIVDQLTEGQLEWVPMPAAYDAVVLGEPRRSRAHRVLTGDKEYFNALRERFPGETAAIDKFEQLTKVPGARARSHSLRSRGCGWSFWLRFLALGSREGKEILPPGCPGDRFLATTQRGGVAQPASTPSQTLREKNLKISILYPKSPASHTELLTHPRTPCTWSERGASSERKEKNPLRAQPLVVGSPGDLPWHGEGRGRAATAPLSRRASPEG